MAWGNGSAEFPATVQTATQADWSYHGDDWGRSSSSVVDESSKPFADLKSKTSVLPSYWAVTRKAPNLSYTSYQPDLSAHSNTVANTDILGWNLDSNLSALLRDNLKLSDSVSTEGWSGVQSCPNHQFDLSELELQTIGSLLPDDDDLYSSAVSELEGSAMANYNGENEELDLFSSGGGLELENDSVPSKGSKKAAEGSSGPSSSLGEHPFGEHPSRTLFVRNINSSVEDAELRVLFEQFGDVRTLYTACKHRGFVMISYYDIRAARSAMRALQNKSLRRRKLDIHFSIPKDNPPDKDVNQGTLVAFNLDSSISNDELRQIFGVYGEVKEIRETPHKRHHKFIEFYDVRAAEAALRALNRCDIAGRRIKLEPSRPGGARRSLMQHLLNEPELDDGLLFKEFSSSPLAKSAPVQAAAIDHIFLEKDPIQETSQYLKLMGLRMQQSSTSELSNGIDPLHYSPAALSAVKARMLSEHLLRMGAAGFSSLSSLESSYTGSLLSDTSALESLPMNGFLGSSLNSVYPKEGHASFWPYVPPRSLYGIGGFSPHGDVMSHTQLVGNTTSINHSHIASTPVTAFPYVDEHKTCMREPFDTPPSPLSMSSTSLSTALGLGGRHSMESRLTNSLSGFASNPILTNGLADPCLHSNFWSLEQTHKVNFVPHTLHESLPRQSDWVMERGRGRKTDNVVSQYDRKQYELDIHRILRGEDLRTTLMIKNIPNKYTSKMLLATVDEHHKGTYDFVYLPIDFKNKCNVGYAFINMTEPSRIVPFYQAFNGKRWEKFNSEKVASLAYARIQGKAALVAHFQNSSLMNEDKRCRPILFHSGGPNMGDQEPFPIGSNPRTRMKARGSSRHHQGSPICSMNKEKLPYGL